MTCTMTQTESADLTIPSGSANSNSVSKEGQSLIGLIVPGSWAPGTTVRIQGFVDGVWCDIWDDMAAVANNNTTLKTAMTNAYVVINPDVSKLWPDLLRLHAIANVSQNSTVRFLYAA